MKRVFSLFSITFLLIAISSFTGTDASEKKFKYDVFKIDSASSIIKWEGKKFTGSHDGTIALKSGELYLKNGKLKGGSFIADMQSITVTDLSGKSKANLEKHLKDEDFFDTENHKTAHFVISKIGENKDGSWKVIGNMTIKDSTKKIAFISKLDLNGKNLTANSKKVVIDRTQFGVKYKSKKFDTDLGDKFIYDNFTLNIKLVAKKVSSKKEL